MRQLNHQEVEQVSGGFCCLLLGAAGVGTLGLLAAGAIGAGALIVWLASQGGNQPTPTPTPTPSDV